MSKIHKGSIVWDLINKEKAKVLTKPGSGELTDSLSKNTGRKYSPTVFGKYVLISRLYRSFLKCNNRSCSIRKIEVLIPYKEYLKTLTTVSGSDPY